MIAALIAIATVAALAGTGAWALTDRVRAEWTCTWRGRTIRLVARQNSHQLYVDGREVARKTTLAGSGVTLVWKTEAEGRDALINASVAYEGDHPVARVLVDGAWIGGTAGDVTPTASPSTAPQPTDARWLAARVLLDGLGTSPDGRHREAAQRIDAGLRAILGKLDALAASARAHQTLGGDALALDSARATLEAQATALLDTLREFHVLAAAQDASQATDRLDELLARVSADAELDRPRPRPTLPERH